MQKTSFQVNKYLRRSIIGFLSGMLGGVLLGITLHNNGLGIVLGVLVGVLYALAFRPTPGIYAENVMTAAFFRRNILSEERLRRPNGTSAPHSGSLSLAWE